MAVVFITGMSGVGKSAVLDHLRNMGYNAVDTDYDYVLEIQGRDGTERYWDIEKSHPCWRNTCIPICFSPGAVITRVSSPGSSITLFC